MRGRRRRRRDSFGADKRLWLYLDRVPHGFWNLTEHRRLYVEWLGEQLGFTRPEDWYQVHRRDFYAHRGSTLLDKYYGSPSATVMACGARYPYLEWRFAMMPPRFWNKRSNRKRYMDWLAAELGYGRMEDWYEITVREIRRNSGRALLDKFDDSPVAILRDYQPSYSWQEWRFARVPQGFWDDQRNRRRYMQWLGRKLGFKRTEDWYGLTTQKIATRYGACLVDRFGGSPIAILRDYLPRYRWLEWRFIKTTEGFWDDRHNRRLYMQWLGSQLGFRRPQDWYAVSADHFKMHHGAGLLAKFGHSPVATVKDRWPDYPWEEWRFPSVPFRFWDDPTNRRRYMDWLGGELGFRCGEDWYQVTTADFEKHHGFHLLNTVGASPLAILRDYLPDYDWKEWLFRYRPKRFWRTPENRLRYLRWLGQQLGYRRARDWSRLSEADLRKHHGSGLLKELHHRVDAIVAEYLVSCGQCG